MQTTAQLQHEIEIRWRQIHRDMQKMQTLLSEAASANKQIEKKATKLGLSNQRTIPGRDTSSIRKPALNAPGQRRRSFRDV
jgi:hypothetical protein